MSRVQPDSFLGFSRETSFQFLSRSLTSSELAKRPETAIARRTNISSNIEQAKAIYGRTPSRGTQLTSSKSTIRLNATTFIPTAVRRKSDKTEAPPRKSSKVVSVRFLEEMRSRTATCKSDFLELQRDIATYEYRFLQTTFALPQLQVTSEFASIVAEKSESAQRRTIEMVEYLKGEIAALDAIEQKYAAVSQSSPPLFRRLNYQLRVRSEHGNMRVVLKGARELSGQNCLLQVHSNGWRTVFKIHALLMSGKHLKLKLPHAVAGVGSDLSATELRKRVDALILKRLYITADSHNLALKFHPNYGKDFVEFAVFVREVGFVAVQVELSDGKLQAGEMEEVTVPVPVDVRSTIELVGRRLWFDTQKQSLEWSETAGRFARKEEDSPFMNKDYVTEKLGSSAIGSSFITECEIGTHKFSVELHTRGGIEKLTIGMGEKMREVQEVDLLRGLQFTYLRNSWTTVLRSLELQLGIRKLFPEVFA